jgi:hypothetical protein
MDAFVIMKPCELEMSYENYLGLIIYYNVKPKLFDFLLTSSYWVT